MGSYVEEMRQLIGSRPLLLVAAGVIVRNTNGAILLQRRTDDRLWGVPGGSLELGETLEEAARRELLEETGLVADELNLLDVYSGPDFFIHYPNGDQAYVVGATFLANVVDPHSAMPDGHEGSELGYFTLSELPQDVNPYNRMLIHRCRDQL